MNPESSKRPDQPGAHDEEVVFDLVADRFWKFPPLINQSGTTVNLALRITNQTSDALRFHLFDTIRIVLTDQAGTPVQLDGGRNGTRPGKIVSAPVPPHESLLISRESRLIRHTQDTLRLIGSDDFGGIWYFDGLQPGKYRIQIAYENDKSRIGELGPIWTGTVETPALDLEIQ